MMERLDIKRFGALTDRQFQLGRTTVFVGPNESGKTTIFDALQECLSKPSRSRAEGKLVKQRYGDEIEASLVGGPETPIDVDEFRSLFAVRASDLNVAIRDDAPWFSAVRARLFSGGVDPMAIVRALEPMTSEHGGRALNRELKQLTERRDALIEDLSKLRLRRDELLSRRDRHEAMQQEHAAALARLAELESALNAAEATATAAERAKERRLLEDRIAKHQRRTSIDQALAALETVSAATFGNLQQLERQVADLVGQERLILARLGDAQVALSRLDEQRVALESQLDGDRGSFDRHQALAIDLQRLTAEPPMRQVIAWQGRWLAVAVASTAAAASLLVWRHDAPAVAAGAAMLIAMTAAACWQSVRRLRVLDESVWDKRLKQIALSAGIEPTGDATAITRHLMATIDRQNARQQEMSRLGRERASAAGACTKLQVEGQRLATARHEAEAILRQALLAAGVESSERYRDRLQEKDRLLTQLGELGGVDLTAAEADTLARRCRILQDDGVPLLQDAEVAWTRAVKAARDARDQFTTAQAALRETQLTLSREAGELQGKLQDLPEQLVRLECDVAAAEEALDRKQIEKEAALMARDVLTEMAADAETRMAGLAGDIAALWASVTDHRDVRVPRLDGKAMEAADAAGTVRQAELLSSGARDLFLLAARLALAARSGRDAAVLVFDDPFVMLDDERRARALKMIAAAQQRCGWQIIFFTKDPQTASDAEKALAEPVVHQLGRS
jgi:DNA repair exonuclease SbcCD ATPase subunit